MNLLVDEISHIAERVVQRVARYGVQRLYVRTSGVPAILCASDPRCDARPAAHLVGTYRSGIAPADVEADLRERLDEIRQEQEA